MSHPFRLLFLCILFLAWKATPTAQAQDLLIPEGSTWKYLDDGSNQGTTWRDPGFNDSSWPQGPAELGYGDGDEATVVNGGPTSNRYVTTYFRRTFSVADPSAYVSLYLQVVRDDGVVVYLNGAEVFRDNMPATAISYNTYAVTALGAPAENEFINQAIPTNGLVSGVNVLAVEIHQANATSSDVSFDLVLTGVDTPMVVRGPYLQQATPDAIVVRWRTDVASPSWVAYGTDPQNLDQMANDPAVTTEHLVPVTSLSPDTLYYYVIGDGTDWFAGTPLDYFKTPPLPGTPAATRVWVIGDSGTADLNAWSVQQAYLNATAGQRADLWLMLGDNAYQTGTDVEFQRAVFDIYTNILCNTVLWSTRGNHESDGNGATYYNIFTFPTAGQAGGLASGTEAYYSFDYANIHFICLDSQGSSRAANGSMATWLQNDLAATTQDWVIAFWHHPPYTKGSHNSDTETQLVEMRANILPILEGAGVDLVLCGHSHSYERSYLLDGHYGTSGNLQPGMILDSGNGREDGDGPYEKANTGTSPHEGAVYVVAGSSGQISGGSLDHPAMVVSLNRLGSVLLDINGDRLDASFLRETGAVDDYFTIIKGAAPAVPPAPTNLIATAGNAQVQLSWNASPGADTYEVRRADVSGGPYTAVASQITATDYTDTAVVNDMTYYYVVVAENEIGASSPSPEVTATPTAVVMSFAQLDIAVAGSVTGDYTATWSTDNIYEQIQERESGGRPSSRHSYLEHKWVFNVAPGNTVTFYVEAFGTSSSEADEFLFEYSFNDANYTPMLTVSKTEDDNTTQSYLLPAGTSGTMYVRVHDTDQTPGRNTLDTLFVDYLAIQSDSTAGGLPPSTPTGLTAQGGDGTVALSWSPSAGASTYNVKRATTSTGTYNLIATGLTVSAYEDTDVQNGQIYYYVVSASNSYGTSPDSDIATATPQVPSVPEAPTSLVASQTGKRKIALTWSQSTTAGVTHNTIYRANAINGIYLPVQTIPADVQYQDSGLTSGETYYYKVSAMSPGGESPLAGPASATAR